MRKQLTTLVLMFLFFSIYAQKTEIDKRALNYYSADQIEKLSDVKIKQINYLYQQSFIIPEEFKTKINSVDIDIRKYSNCRLPDKKAKVALIKGDEREVSQGESVYIYLISIRELQEAYKRIK